MTIENKTILKPRLLLKIKDTHVEKITLAIIANVNPTGSLELWTLKFPREYLYTSFTENSNLYKINTLIK
jgi:hypothetical protein